MKKLSVSVGQRVGEAEDRATVIIIFLFFRCFVKTIVQLAVITNLALISVPSRTFLPLRYQLQLVSQLNRFRVIESFLFGKLDLEPEFVVVLGHLFLISLSNAR